MKKVTLTIASIMTVVAVLTLAGCPSPAAPVDNPIVVDTSIDASSILYKFETTIEGFADNDSYYTNDLEWRAEVDSTTDGVLAITARNSAASNKKAVATKDVRVGADGIDLTGKSMQIKIYIPAGFKAETSGTGIKPLIKTSSWTQFDKWIGVSDLAEGWQTLTIPLDATFFDYNGGSPIAATPASTYTAVFTIGLEIEAASNNDDILIDYIDLIDSL